MQALRWKGFLATALAATLVLGGCSTSPEKAGLESTQPDETRSDTVVYERQPERGTPEMHLSLHHVPPHYWLEIELDRVTRIQGVVFEREGQMDRLDAPPLRTRHRIDNDGRDWSMSRVVLPWPVIEAVLAERGGALRLITDHGDYRAPMTRSDNDVTLRHILRELD